MSQARFLTSVSFRVLERSAAARQFTYGQRRYFETGASTSNAPCSSRSLHRYGRTSKTSYYVANPTVPNIVRSLSTNSPQTSVGSRKATEPPPPTVSGKKAKVELRPGPTKSSGNAPSAKTDSVVAAAQPQAVRSQAISDVKHHPTKPPPLIVSSGEEGALKEVEGKRAVEIARKDVDEAARHGILKPPPPDASKVGRLIHQVKELFKFYVAGLKYIYVHKKEVWAIQQRIKSGGPPLSWREHRFILTNNSDLIKLVPFLLVVLLVEELIPLIVLYVPGMLPSTCVLPSQRERIEAKRRERQRGAYALAKSMDSFKDILIQEIELKTLDGADIGLLSSTVGISSRGVLSMQRIRLEKYLRKIAAEDKLLLAEGQGAKLTKTEIVTALTDRGFLPDSYTSSQQRKRLRWWLENVDNDDAASKISPEDVRARLLVLMLREARI